MRVTRRALMMQAECRRYLSYTNRRNRWTSLPLQIEFAVGGCAISEIQIDETLVRNADIGRDGLEVAQALFIQTNGDLLFELGSVRVLHCLGKIVFGTHGFYLS